jgi:hypothetical protein
MVAACSTEVCFIPENEQPVITLQIAQNQTIAEAEISLRRLRDLLYVLIEEVRKCNAEEWNVREGVVHLDVLSLAMILNRKEQLTEHRCADYI